MLLCYVNLHRVLDAKHIECTLKTGSHCVPVAEGITPVTCYPITGTTSLYLPLLHATKRSRGLTREVQLKFRRYNVYM